MTRTVCARPTFVRSFVPACPLSPPTVTARQGRGRRAARMPRHNWTTVLAPFVQVPNKTQNKPQFPSTATSCRLSALDLTSSDNGWQCACHAVEQRMRHVPTYGAGRRQRAIEERSIFDAVSRVAERVRATGFPLCQQGRVFNPYAALRSTECSHHLPIFELFPPVGAASGPARPANSSAHEYVREWLGNIRPWYWDCVPNTYPSPMQPTCQAGQLTACVATRRKASTSRW